MRLEIHELSASINNIKINNLVPDDDKPEDTNLTCHIDITLAMSNKQLAMLDPGLMKALFQKKPRKDSNPQEFLEIEDNFFPHLRFPQLKTIPWDFKGSDYTFQLLDDRPVSGDTVIVSNCTINKMKIILNEGGTIELSMSLHGNPNKEEQISNLFHYIQREIEISIIPPDETAQKPLIPEAELIHIGTPATKQQQAKKAN